MKDIINTTKYLTAITLLKSDPKVEPESVHIVDDQILFCTTDPTSDEQEGTGYYSDEGYNYQEHGLSVTTENELQQLGFSIIFNDCESFENEGSLNL